MKERGIEERRNRGREGGLKKQQGRELYFSRSTRTCILQKCDGRPTIKLR